VQYSYITFLAFLVSVLEYKYSEVRLSRWRRWCCLEDLPGTPGAPRFSWLFEPFFRRVEDRGM